MAPESFVQMTDEHEDNIKFIGITSFGVRRTFNFGGEKNTEYGKKMTKAKGEVRKAIARELSHATFGQDKKGKSRVPSEKEKRPNNKLPFRIVLMDMAGGISYDNTFQAPKHHTPHVLNAGAEKAREYMMMKVTNKEELTTMKTLLNAKTIAGIRANIFFWTNHRKTAS